MKCSYCDMDYNQIELRTFMRFSKQKWYQRIHYWLIRHLLPKNTTYKLMYGGRLFHATKWHKECLNKSNFTIE